MEKLSFGSFDVDVKIEDEGTARLVDALVDSPELDEWLDVQIQRGDHHLQDQHHFRWDDIRLPVRPRLRRVLALRMLEAKS